jgi:hypothetical protein
MAGAPLHPYHFASYMFPALIAMSEDYASLAAYSSFLLPAGVFIFGLGAYVLGRYLFGKEGGFAVGVCILLLPDPFQQGFGNLFLGQSYWLIQSIPAMPFGVAASALVFVFLFEGFRMQSWRWILASYCFVAVTLLYKAHLFVAIAWPALILPALFMGTFSKKNPGARCSFSLSSFLGLPSTVTAFTKHANFATQWLWICRLYPLVN